MIKSLKSSRIGYNYVINYKYLVGENAEELGKMDTGISYMFTNKRTEELKKAYKLISLYPDSLKVIISAFSPYIKKRGEEINGVIGPEYDNVPESYQFNFVCKGKDTYTVDCTIDKEEKGKVE